jgi:hypothetical protein
MPARPNATRADITAMLRDGHSNSRIMRELRCDKQRVIRIRTELDLPAFVKAEQTRTLEEKWALFTRPVEDGHLLWTGTRGTSAGTPVLAYKENLYTAASIAFTIQHGRQPHGYVLPDCGMKHCVAPAHVNDEAGRQQTRREARAQRGLGDVPAKCVSGHDLVEHAKFEPDGTAYCGLCKALDKRAQRDPSVPRPPRLRPASLDEAFQRHTALAEDGHVRWTGSTSHTTPTVWFEGSLRSAYKVAFRLHHGREPEGIVTPSCDGPLCVAGAHVEDQPMRRRHQQEERKAKQREEQLDCLYAGIFGGAA